MIGPLAFDAKVDLVQQPFTWLVFKDGKYGDSGMRKLAGSNGFGL